MSIPTQHFKLKGIKYNIDFEKSPNSLHCLSDFQLWPHSLLTYIENYFFEFYPLKCDLINTVADLKRIEKRSGNDKDKNHTIVSFFPVISFNNHPKRLFIIINHL